MNFKVNKINNSSAARLLEVKYQKAADLINKKKYQEALALLDSILKKQPEHRLAKRSKPVALFHMGRQLEAARLFHQLHEQDPEDLVILKHCGVAYTAVGAFEIAIQFLSRYVKSKPNDFDAWTSLSAAAGKSQQYVEAMFYATQALSLEPTNPNAYNNLGATLLGVNKMEEGEQAFETALLLDKNNVDALSNLATLAHQRGNYESAVTLYNNLIKNLDPNTNFAKEVIYRSSFSHLATCDLTEGWRRYDLGFLPTDRGSRTPKRQFQEPQWHGEPLGDKCLLIWGEQGLGDEIIFFSLLNEVQNHCSRIIVECEPRLVSLFERSFPNLKIKATKLNPKELTYSKEFDVHIPVGSLMGLFCNTITDFEKFKPYIKPNPHIANDFADRLNKVSGKKLVGLCWRSGKLNTNRNLHYLSIDDLTDVLKLEDCTFVNLQYGDCEDELTRIENKLNIKILRWNDVDLKNDQEQLAALISCLDVVVTAGTAVMALSMTLGKKTIMFGPKGWDFLGQDKYPWSPIVEAFSPSTGDELISVIPNIIKRLNNL